MIYTILFLIGIVGLLTQLLLGVSHHSGGHVHSGHGALGHGPAASHGHPAPMHHAGAPHGGGGHNFDIRHALSPLLALLSPMTLFSLCIGGGATGLLLHPLHWRANWVMLAAIAGASVFYGVFVRPLCYFILQFASKPSEALAGIVSKPAEALTSFKGGQGIVNVNVDGQIVRVLATLENDEREVGATIKPGDELTVTSVDGKTNTCRVTRL